MRAIFPPGAGLVGEPQVDLVDERGRLQRVIRPLAPQRRAGEPPQFVIDDREQRRHGILVASGGLDEQLRDVGAWWGMT